MSSGRRIANRIAELSDRGVPFVQATVVRAQCPTSARPGDAAVVHADGSVEGFVGGQCAEGSVRLAAGDVLSSGEALLLRILPEGDDPRPDEPGARTVVNPCLSGGAIEVFLEPKLPAARVCIVGNTPIADALVQLGHSLGFATEQVNPGDSLSTGALAVVVSSHGRGEEEAIRAALDAGVGFIGLVASHTRADAVIESLDLNNEERAAVRSPVGVDIGARTAEEIALSICAELVREIRVEGLVAPKSQEPIAVAPETALDPICGMTVIVEETTPHLHLGGTDYWYCNVGCRDRHADDLAIGA